MKRSIRAIETWLAEQPPHDSKISLHVLDRNNPTAGTKAGRQYTLNRVKPGIGSDGGSMPEIGAEIVSPTQIAAGNGTPCKMRNIHSTTPIHHADRQWTRTPTTFLCFAETRAAQMRPARSKTYSKVHVPGRGAGRIAGLQ